MNSDAAETPLLSIILPVFNDDALRFCDMFIVFLPGLISEQIASLRLEKSDKLFSIEDTASFREVAEMVRAADPLGAEHIH
jgi:hypothetical protein